MVHLQWDSQHGRLRFEKIVAFLAPNTIDHGRVEGPYRQP